MTGFSIGVERSITRRNLKIRITRVLIGRRQDKKKDRQEVPCCNIICSEKKNLPDNGVIYIEIKIKIKRDRERGDNRSA